MSNSIKILLTALIVAVVVGSLGFAAGYVGRGLLTRSSTPAQPPLPIDEVVAATPATPQPAASPEPPVPPTAEPTELLPVAEPTPEVELQQAFSLFWEAWDKVAEQYYGEVPSNEEIVNGAIQGALATLGDPYTGFVDAKAAAIEAEDQTGSYGGIGAYVSLEGGYVQIVGIIKGTPAEAADLRKGDYILEAGGTLLEGMSIYEAITYIRGPAGSTVHLKILREGAESFEIDVVRAQVEIVPISYEMRTDGIAYIQLSDFTTNNPSSLVAAAIEELSAEQPAALILDLRSNPGGYLNEAILTAGLFLPVDSLVVTERWRDGTEERLTTPYEPVAPDIPLVVLVDAASASASEIVAGALQDYGRATLIGETTFGKGSVSLVNDLSDGSQIWVTTARWFTPNDRAIHGTGLAPDIEVLYTQEDVEAGVDPQLARAVEFLSTGK
ncbi:MAG TPA: S41 family peptidase [Anaerolineae bacterium]|nr:S41 family peptidase [Anaerolineae bacterium]